MVFHSFFHSFCTEKGLLLWSLETVVHYKFGWSIYDKGQIWDKKACSHKIFLKIARWWRLPVSWKFQVNCIKANPIAHLLNVYFVCNLLKHLKIYTVIWKKIFKYLGSFSDCFFAAKILIVKFFSILRLACLMAYL